MDREVKIGALYKHFKGNIYKVLNIGKSCDNLEDLVVYENIKTKEVWIRRKVEFLSKTDKNKYPDMKQDYRFEEVKNERF